MSRVLALRTFGRTPLELVAPPALLLLSIGVGLALVSQPFLAFLPLAALAAALLLVDGRARTLFVVFGGFFILQRPGGLDVPRMAFVAGVAVAFVAALVNVRAGGPSDAYRAARPLFAASVVFFSLAGVSVAVAYANETPSTDWLRDVAPYVLFACAPIFALDARASFASRGLVRLLVAVGLLGAGAFAVAWLNRRGIAQLPIQSLALASLFLPAALFAYAVAVSLQQRLRRARWLLLAALILGTVATTGNRTALALLVVPLAVAVGARRQLAVRSVRLVAAGPLLIGVTVIVGFVVLAATDASTAQLEERFSALRASGDSGADASYNDRITQSKVAWGVFASQPLLGAGPGVLFEWKPQGMEKTASFVLDTPLTFPAKFGLAGIAGLLVVVLSFLAFVRNISRGQGPTVERLAVVGYLAVVGALSIFAPPFEDKGFSFALILLLALALRPLPVSPPPRADARGSDLVHRAGDAA